MWCRWPHSKLLKDSWVLLDWLVSFFFRHNSSFVFHKYGCFQKVKGKFCVEFDCDVWECGVLASVWISPSASCLSLFPIPMCAPCVKFDPPFLRHPPFSCLFFVWSSARYVRWFWSQKCAYPHGCVREYNMKCCGQRLDTSLCLGAPIFV